MLLMPGHFLVGCGDHGCVGVGAGGVEPPAGCELVVWDVGHKGGEAGCGADHTPQDAPEMPSRVGATGGTGEVCKLPGGQHCHQGAVATGHGALAFHFRDSVADCICQ